MRDGVELAGRLYRPGRARVPDAVAHAGVVSEFAPYPVEGYESRHRYLAERGYAVLVCTVRGSGDSGGRYTTWFPPEEPKDNHDLIEWLADQPYCTGDVGPIGDS